MKKYYKSKALWPEGTIAYNPSEDSHDTESAAFHVCKRLEKEGFGGDGKIFPIRTWVEPVHPLNDDTHDEDLPYTFDLLWDIKTKSKLFEHYQQLKNEIKDIEEVCEEHKIVLPNKEKT